MKSYDFKTKINVYYYLQQDAVVLHEQASWDLSRLLLRPSNGYRSEMKTDLTHLKEQLVPALACRRETVIFDISMLHVGKTGQHKFVKSVGFRLQK